MSKNQTAARCGGFDGRAVALAAGIACSYAAIKSFLTGAPAGVLAVSGSFAFGLGTCLSIALFGAVAAVLICFACAFADGLAIDDGRVRSWNRSGSVLMIAACVIALIQPLAGWTSWLATACVGIVGGLGILAVALSWGVAFSREEPLFALTVAAASFAAAQVFDFAFGLFPDAGMHYAAVAVLTAAAHLVFSASFVAARESGAATPRDVREESCGPAAVRDQASAAARLLWMPLAGAALMVFIFGLTWDPVASGENRFDVVEHIGELRTLGGLIGAVAVFAFASRGGGAARLRMMHGTLLPAAVAVILALPVITVDEGSFLSHVFQVLQYAGFAIIQLSVWSAMVATSQSVRIHPGAVFAASMAVFGASGAIGIALIHVIGLGGKELCVLLLAAYMALIAASFALETRIERTARAEDEIRPESFIRRRCDELRDACGISPREAEVLFYLGRGYSLAYISRKLFVSESTVRTHVHHIYAKLGISSREDLLDLIDGNDA